MPPNPTEFSDHSSDAGVLAPFCDIAASDPMRTYARFRGTALSFGEIDSRSDAIVAWLSRKGVGEGDLIAVMAANSADVINLLFGLAKLGAVWVPLNVQAVGDNLAYILDHSQPRLVVVDDELHDTVAVCSPDLELVCISALKDLQIEDATISRQFPAPDVPFAVMYTSGTTGRPKGAIVSHRMLRLAGEAVALVSAAQDGDNMHMWEPLFHIGGAQMLVLPLIRTVTLDFAEKFSARQFWQEVQAAGASHIHFLGGILQILLKQPTDIARQITWCARCLGWRLPTRDLASFRGTVRRRDPRVLRHDRVFQRDDSQS